MITDEVYEHLTFDGHEHVPIATLPGMVERTLTLSSAGKTLRVTGWKVGWATGPAELVAAVAGGEAVADVHLGRSAAAGRRARARPRAGLARGAGGPTWRQARPALRRARQARRSTYAVPEGTYFAPPTSRRSGWQDGMEFCLALPERAGVVAIPTQPFHDSGGGRPAGALGVLQGAST